MKFDLNRLTRILKADTGDLLYNPQRYWKNISNKENKRFIYINNNSNVLAIAHLDTVENNRMWKIGKQPEKPNSKVTTIRAGFDDVEINSIALDDRLGVYFIMDILPLIGINVDVLLTTDEEIGMSTASSFFPTKKYNWMFQFDRRGIGNVVMYQFENADNTYASEESGYRVETGTFSDICMLDDIGCSGFNFGCGYVEEHSTLCFTRISWMNTVVNMFVDFYNKNKDYHFKYNKTNYAKTDSKKTGTKTAITQNKTNSDNALDDLVYSRSDGGVYGKKVNCVTCGLEYNEWDLTFDMCDNCIDTYNSIKWADQDGNEIDKVTGRIINR